MSPDPSSSGDEDAREEKRRRFAEKRKSHYQMKAALCRCATDTDGEFNLGLRLNSWLLTSYQVLFAGRARPSSCGLTTSCEVKQLNEDGSRCDYSGNGRQIN